MFRAIGARYRLGLLVTTYKTRDLVFKLDASRFVYEYAI